MCYYCIMFKKKELKEKKSLLQDFLELLRFTVLVLVIVIPLRIFIAQPFIVNGQSMMPTFKNGDYLIVDELTFKYSEPKRGEVIVFRLPSNHKRFLIKRIIGLPGETVSISGNKIKITKKNGNIINLNENYTNGPFSSYGTWNLNNNEYFVMGDNRNNSSDSRSWGLLDKNLIIGKTFLRLFPFNNVNVNPGQASQNDIEVNIEK